MKFVSLFNPVSLPSDPESANEGDLYYNSTEGVYKVKLNGVWTSLLSDSVLKVAIAPEIFTVGSGTASATEILEQYHSENIINCVSASLTNIVIPEQSTTNIHIGSRIGIARGSDGDVQIIAGDPLVELNIPSNVYLTKSGTEGRLINLALNKWIFDAEYPDMY